MCFLTSVSGLLVLIPFASLSLPIFRFILCHLQDKTSNRCNITQGEVWLWRRPHPSNSAKVVEIYNVSNRELQKWTLHVWYDAFPVVWDSGSFSHFSPASPYVVFKDMVQDGVSYFRTKEETRKKWNKGFVSAILLDTAAEGELGDVFTVLGVTNFGNRGSNSKRKGENWYWETPRSLYHKSKFSTWYLISLPSSITALSWEDKFYSQGSYVLSKCVTLYVTFINTFNLFEMQFSHV